MTTMHNRPLLAAIADMIAEQEARYGSTAARTSRPLLDGHSDGKRVSYVRAETAAATLRAVMDVIANGGAA